VPVKNRTSIVSVPRGGLNVRRFNRSRSALHCLRISPFQNADFGENTLQEKSERHLSRKLRAEIIPDMGTTVPA